MQAKFTMQSRNWSEKLSPKSEYRVITKRYAAGIVNWSGGMFGLQQTAEVWKLTHPSEKFQNSNPYSSHVLQARLEARIQMHFLALWYLNVLFTILRWVILSARTSFYIKTQNCVKLCRMWWVDTTFLESGCINELFNPNIFFPLLICQPGNSRTIRHIWIWLLGNLIIITLIFIQKTLNHTFYFYFSCYSTTSSEYCKQKTCVVIHFNAFNMQYAPPFKFAMPSAVKVLSWMCSKYDLCCLDSSTKVPHI